MTHDTAWPGTMVTEILGLLDTAVQRSGQSEATFCVKTLSSNPDLREKLMEGRITLRTLAKLKQRLEKYLG